jgi:N-acetyl sugar amidotransferase
MRYCTRCILPDTRPGLVLDSEGVCSACRNFELRKTIDWTARAKAFEAVITNAKARSKGYDCLIPVSGGKDSTWQTIVCLEMGLNPLCVTWKTPARTEIGRKNLENLISLGVDHIDYQVSPAVEKKFMLDALKRFGSTAIPMHLALFNIPLKIAARFDIPLIIWGENSAFEYGEPGEARLGFKLDSNWLRKYGVTHGTTAEDWISDRLTRKELTPYFGPDPDELDRQGVLAVFLGYYLPWDVKTSYDAARARGFQAEQGGARTGIYDFADIDDDFISLHHYLKWYKFGFPRSFDNLSLEIRHGRLTRDEAIEIACGHGDGLPQKDIEKFCAFTGISTCEFFDIIEKYRNTNVWQRESGGWRIRDFLINNWNWR